MNIDKSSNAGALVKLENEYKKYHKVLIALSGGVDSCLASFLGRKFLGKDNAVAVISKSPSLKEKDYRVAADFCNTHDINFEVIFTKEMEDPNYFSNPINRCYFCKSELYDEMESLLKKSYPGFKIINGNNYTDLGDYRPGLDAAKENNAYSPFIACGVTKDMIRSLALEFNLSVWDKPASPCLSSRFPYGEEITYEKLKRVEKAEEILNEMEFDEVRVRSYGDTAKIEVPAEKILDLKAKMEPITEKFMNLGFQMCEIDNEGFISGKLNRAIK